MNKLIVKIRFLIPSLPRAEKAVAQALLDNPEAILHMNLATIAQETGSSEASVIRFCRHMDFSGFTEMKQAFARAVAEGEQVHEEELEKSDDMSTILKKVFQSNVQTLNDTLILAEDEKYTQALDALLNAKAIHFFGTGDAQAVCQLAYMKFSRLGIPCTANSDVMLQLITAGNIQKGDVAIAISYEGRSKNIVQSMEIAKERGATTISITKMNKSPLLRYTDIALFIAISDLTIGRDKVTRRVADQFIMDALYLGYITKKGIDYSDHLRKVQSAIDSNKVKK